MTQTIRGGEVSVPAMAAGIAHPRVPMGDSELLIDITRQIQDATDLDLQAELRGRRQQIAMSMVRGSVVPRTGSESYEDTDTNNAGPRTLVNHFKAQLREAEAGLEGAQSDGAARVAEAHWQAGQIRAYAEGEAHKILEPVEQAVRERSDTARTEAEAVRHDAKRRAERIKQVAADQLTNVPALFDKVRFDIPAESFHKVDFSLLEAETPPALPLDLMAQLPVHDAEAYTAAAHKYANDIRLRAEAKRIQIISDADVTNQEEMRQAQARALSIRAEANRQADALVRRVTEEAEAAVQRAQERARRVQSRLAHQQQQEVTASRQGVKDTLGADAQHATEDLYATAPLGHPVAFVPSSSRLSEHAMSMSGKPSEATVPQVRQTGRARRPEAPKRWNRVVSAGLAATAVVGAVLLVTQSSKEATPQLSPAEHLADEDAAVPKWFPGKAWQQELAKALLDPRLAVGPEYKNYVLGDPATHQAGLGAIPELLMFLGSMDNEHTQTGLVPLDTQSAKGIASRLKVDYVVEAPDGKVKATPQTAYDTILITVEKSNEILDDMFKNTADKKSYTADPAKLLSTFISKWTIDDANGKPAPLPAEFQQAFTAIGVDMIKGASGSDTLQKLLQDPARQQTLQTVTDLLKKEGVLTPAEEKAGS